MRPKQTDFLQQVNAAPVTFAVLLAYVTMAYLTGSLSFGGDSNKLVEHGAAVGILIVDGEAWRILSHAFLHGNLVHLLLNSYALVLFGPVLEQHLGSVRFAVLYVLTACAGCILALMVGVDYTTLVGGSGALFGMLGALLALNVRGGRTMLDFLENHGARQLLGLIVINLVIGWVIPVVSNSAHVGGLIAGFVIVFGFFDTGRRGKVDITGRLIQAGWVALFVTLLLYQVQPVLRFDYTLKQYLQTEDPARRQELRRILEDDAFSPEQRAYLIDVEPEPRTGIPGVALREHELGRHVRRIQRTIQRWKKAR